MLHCLLALLQLSLRPLRKKKRASIPPGQHGKSARRHRVKRQRACVCMCVPNIPPCQPKARLQIIMLQNALTDHPNRTPERPHNFLRAPLPDSRAPSRTSPGPLQDRSSRSFVPCNAPSQLVPDGRHIRPTGVRLNSLSAGSTR